MLRLEVHGRQHRSRWRDTSIVAMPTCHERQVYSTGVINEESNLQCLKQSRWGEGQDSEYPEIEARASRWRKNYKAEILLEARRYKKLKGYTSSFVLCQHAIIHCFRDTYLSNFFNCSLCSGMIRASFHNVVFCREEFSFVAGTSYIFHNNTIPQIIMNSFTCFFYKWKWLPKIYSIILNLNVCSCMIVLLAVTC